MDEVILRTLVMQSDGRVVEIFGAEHSGIIRYHVALLKEPQASDPGRLATAVNCPDRLLHGTD